jgi:tetratricopeptide (TPR) repeat protein
LGGGEGRIFPLLALILLLAYAAFWFMADRAQAQLIRAARNGDVSAAQEAAALDPSLSLYELQIAYLTGNMAQGDPSLRGEAIRLYEAALQREPTWDTGWVNLAGLYEQDGRYEDALAALERADSINRGNPARFNWARIAEAHNLASDEAIISAYLDEMTKIAWRQLPLSSFWMETPLRRAALEQLYDEVATDGQRRRLAAVHFPERLADLPAAPPDLSTGDGWVEAARASNLWQIAADYQDTPVARIEYMLNRAELLLTNYESPNALRAFVAERLGAPLETINRYRLAAVPPRYQDQNFEGVLFGGRAAGLDVFPFMRRPGGGYPLFAPYYEVAESYEAAGDSAGATQIYRYILDYAPDETLARERLAALDREAVS